jgi:hypothetical protein
MSERPPRRPPRDNLPTPGRLPISMQNRIQAKLRTRHEAVLKEYLELVPAARGDDPRLQDLARCIGELEIALERLERGEYGTCLVCGRSIGQRRLLERPLIERCARCEGESPSPTE